MKHSLLLICAAGALALGAAHAAPKHHPPAKAPAPPAKSPAVKSPAVKAADTWLALVDAAHYDKSWDDAAAGFKAKVTSAQWAQAMQQVRVPLGAVKTRTFASAKRTTTLPGADAGDYAVVQYSTVFAAKPSVETVVLSKEADGQWRTSGYFIR